MKSFLALYESASDNQKLNVLINFYKREKERAEASIPFMVFGEDEEDFLPNITLANECGIMVELLTELQTYRQKEKNKPEN